MLEMDVMQSKDELMQLTPPEIRDQARNVEINLLPDKSRTKMKPSTLWSTYSMLKATLNIKNNIDLAKYLKLRAFLKRYSDGFHAKKSRVFQREEIEKFLSDAPDELYLCTKVSSQERELLSQASTISRLEEALNTAEKNLHNSENNLKMKQEEFTELLRHLQNEVDLNCSMKEEICSLRETKTNLENQSKYLEDQLDDYMSNCEELKEENISIRENLEEVSLELIEEKKKVWFRDRKEIASISLAALQKIAKVVFLPVYRHY